jgi:tetratricopeptide (TPR) repeat protein
MTSKNMDLKNPVIQLCIQGTRAELERRPEDARTLYQQAWDVHTNDYEACIAAHYLARFQGTLESAFRWNLIALQHANAIHDESVKDFLPSLYLSLGNSYEVFGNIAEAQKYYQLAAELGFIHQPG